MEAEEKAVAERERSDVATTIEEVRASGQQASAGSAGARTRESSPARSHTEVEAAPPKLLGEPFRKMAQGVVRAREAGPTIGAEDDAGWRLDGCDLCRGSTGVDRRRMEVGAHAPRRSSLGECRHDNHYTITDLAMADQQRLLKRVVRYPSWVSGEPVRDEPAPEYLAIAHLEHAEDLAASHRMPGWPEAMHMWTSRQPNKRHVVNLADKSATTILVTVGGW